MPRRFLRFMPPAAKGIFRAPERGSLFSGFCLRRPHFFQRRKGNVPCPRARVTFGRSPKSDQKRCLKPQVSRLPARLGCAENLPRCTTRDPTWHRSPYNESLAVRLSLPLPCSVQGRAGLPLWRLSNRALAASGGKCRCGPLGRHFKFHIGRAWHYPAERGSGSGERGRGDSVWAFSRRIEIGTKEIQKPSVFGGVLFHISFAVERNMAAGGIEKKVVGPLRPKVTRARKRGTFPLKINQRLAAGGA